MKTQFTGTACIVGAGGGIGEALTRLLHAQGARGLVLFDRPGPALDALARDTASSLHHLDLRDEAASRPSPRASHANSPRVASP